MFPLLCLSLALGAEPDPAMTLDRLAQLLDECEVIPPRECGHQKVVRRSEKGLVADEYENVFFTTDTNCSNYYYGQADAGLPVALKMIECRNPEYAFSLVPAGDTYNVYHFEIARRCLLETKKNANYIGGVSPGLSEAEVSLYHTFSSLVAWNRDRFSDLIRNPATRCTILRKSPLHFALTGRSMEPLQGSPERSSATIRISRSGKYAYVTESHGTVTYGNGQRHEATIVNEVVEMETHPPSGVVESDSQIVECEPAQHLDRGEAFPIRPGVRPRAQAGVPEERLRDARTLRLGIRHRRAGYTSSRALRLASRFKLLLGARLDVGRHRPECPRSSLFKATLAQLTGKLSFGSPASVREKNCPNSANFHNFAEPARPNCRDHPN